MKITSKNCLNLRSGQTIWRATVFFNGTTLYGYVTRIRLTGKIYNSQKYSRRVGKNHLRDVYGYGGRVGAFTKKTAADRWLAAAIAGKIPGALEAAIKDYEFLGDF